MDKPGFEPGTFGTKYSMLYQLSYLPLVGVVDDWGLVSWRGPRYGSVNVIGGYIGYTVIVCWVDNWGAFLIIIEYSNDYAVF